MTSKLAMGAFAVSLSAMLCGCEGHYHKVMDRDLKALVGKNIKTAVDRFGYPTQKLTVAADTVYVWSSDGCTLRIGTDASDHILRSDYDGDKGDCKKYYRALPSNTTNPGLSGH